MSKNLPAHPCEQMLPPILAGSYSPNTRRRVEQFFFSVASCFESWVTRRQSPHTQRTYREDFMALVKFLGIERPGQAWKILTVSIKDVMAFRDHLVAKDAAAEIRLPITVPNPTHAQFIARESTDPRDETKALSATRAATNGNTCRRHSARLPRSRHPEILSVFGSQAFNCLPAERLRLPPGRR
jgi:hypothetical protein